jgi:hypothetical protein
MINNGLLKELYIPRGSLLLLLSSLLFRSVRQFSSAEETPFHESRKFPTRYYTQLNTSHHITSPTEREEEEEEHERRPHHHQTQ